MHLVKLVFISLVGLSAAGKAEDDCITLKGAKQVNPVPTVVHTLRETRKTFLTTYIQPHSTVTPKAVTRTAQTTTVVTISKTLGSGTNIVTVTEYVTSTMALFPTTVTVTETIPTTVTTKTIIIVPTPTGFKPIQDTLSGATYLKSGSKRQDTEAEQQDRRQADSRPPNAQRRDNKKRANSYPQKVDCRVTQIIPTTLLSRESLPPDTITANTPIRTVTNIQTITDTRTIVPTSASGVATYKTTNIIAETLTLQTTVTKTETTTAAIAKVPGPTMYEACRNRNFANSKNKKGAFLRYKLNSGGPLISSSATNPQGCCEACAGSYACVGFLFGDACALVKNDGTCSAGKPCTGSVEFNAQIDRHLYVMGNGGGFQWNRYLPAQPLP